jgi:predicted metal-dependent peptidase
MHSQILSETISRLLYKQPFFGVLLGNNITIVEDESMPAPAATDGYKRILTKPSVFNAWNRDEREFVLCHEIMHWILLHMPRAKMYMARGFGPDMKPFNAKKWNQACDFYINYTLTQAGVGTMPSMGLYNPNFTSDMTPDEIYLLLPDEEEEEDGDGRGPDGHGGFDEHLPPEPGAEAPSESEIEREIQGATTVAEGQGKMPAALKKLVGEILDPKVPWTEVLQGKMTASSGRDATTWNKPNRRRLVAPPHIYMPGRTGYQIGGVALVLDRSGSCDDMGEVFLAEVSAIMEQCQPQWLRVYWTDTDVRHVDEVDDPVELLDLEMHGGGGTDMEAAFRYIEEEGLIPEYAVVLTDGYTNFSDGPSFPVIWAITTNVEPPYGELVHIED